MRNIITALLLFAFPSIILAQDITSEARTELKEIQNIINVTQKLEQNSLIASEQSATIVKYELELASQIVGHPINQQELDKILSNSQSAFSVFLNVVIVLAAILLFMSITGLLGWYLWPLLAEVPPIVYEFFAYTICLGLMFAPFVIAPLKIGFFLFDPFWFVIPAALGFLGCLKLTSWLHFETTRLEIGCGIAASVYAFVAYNLNIYFPEAYVPYILGFMSVMALEAFLGFSVLIIPGIVAVGWEKEDAVARATATSLFLMFLYLISQLNPQSYFEVFKVGFLFMGTFVYYLGLLILSSYYYNAGWIDGKYVGYNTRYWTMQAITIISGIVAFYIGIMLGVGILLGVGGTFFTLYLCEKYAEIPWNGVGWLWAALGLAGFLYLFVGFAQKNPQYFLWNY